jgi:hypothetical protein
MPESAGHNRCGKKPSILERSNPASRRDPNSTAVVLKEGPHAIIRQSTASFAVYGNLAVLPSVQAIDSPQPNAAIPRREDGRNSGTRQTLRDGSRGDREVSKAVEATTRGDPNVALPIFKEIAYEIT